MQNHPTIQQIRQALEPLIEIPRPYGDNEGDPINGCTVFPYLSDKEQRAVRHAEELLYTYTRTLDGEVNRRALTSMTRNGFNASLGPSQYDPDFLDGRVEVGEWEIDISDPRDKASDD